METLLIIIALVLSIAGILGCIIPGIPGPPINLIAMLVLQWTISPFRPRLLMIWTIITIGIIMID